MTNQNLVQQELVVFTSASLTLGMAASGQTVPPRYVICEPTGAMTITLPLSTAALPSQTSGVGGSPVPSFGPGYPITFFNNSSQTITISAASGDTLLNGTNLSTQYSAVTYVSVPTENKWYNLSGAGGSVSAARTVTVAGLGSSSATQTAFLSDGNYIVTGVSEVHGTASSSGTLQVEKATGTTAAGSGTNILTATISLSGTANTVVAGTLVATTATLTLASGNRLNLVIAGTMTSFANGVVEISLRSI